MAEKTLKDLRMSGLLSQLLQQADSAPQAQENKEVASPEGKGVSPSEGMEADLSAYIPEGASRVPVNEGDDYNDDLSPYADEADEASFMLNGNAMSQEEKNAAVEGSLEARKYRLSVADRETLEELCGGDKRKQAVVLTWCELNKGRKGKKNINEMFSKESDRKLIAEFENRRSSKSSKKNKREAEAEIEVSVKKRGKK